jgi:hypothetical protein
MVAPLAQEPLRDRVGRALYEEPGKGLDWYALSEERREPWRKDADRVLAILNLSTSIKLRSLVERAVAFRIDDEWLRDARAALAKAGA